MSIAVGLFQGLGLNSEVYLLTNLRPSEVAVILALPVAMVKYSDNNLRKDLFWLTVRGSFHCAGKVSVRNLKQPVILCLQSGRRSYLPKPTTRVGLPTSALLRDSIT